MRERAEATASSARWCCLIAPSSSRSATASASEVSDSVTRRPRAISSSRPSAMSLLVCVARLMPPRRRTSVNTSTAAPTATSAHTSVPAPLPGAAAALDGRAAAARAAAAIAQAREARVRVEPGIGRWLVIPLASASGQAGLSSA